MFPGIEQPESIANISRLLPNFTWPRVWLSNVKTSSYIAACESKFPENFVPTIS
jgi:hypothetical protein